MTAVQNFTPCPKMLKRFSSTKTKLIRIPEECKIRAVSQVCIWYVLSTVHSTVHHLSRCRWYMYIKIHNVKLLISSSARELFRNNENTEKCEGLGDGGRKMICCYDDDQCMRRWFTFHVHDNYNTTRNAIKTTKQKVLMNAFPQAD